ncbi:MAG: flagellar biosynthesis protein FliQ [Alphaproteobacteria bacterium]
MNDLAVLEIARDAIWTMLTIGAPLMLGALAIGLIVALFQALTQIQEMTLTFVPKIIVMAVMLILLLPFMGGAMGALMERLVERIVTGV